MIAETTHIEVSSATILGLIASSVPFPHHNQSPRNTYQCAMGKQALGVAFLTNAYRTDNVIYNLVYPQRPLVDSLTLKLVGFHHMPAGQNVNLAILSISGYDIEDAVLLNEASVQRGMGRVLVTKKNIVELEATESFGQQMGGDGLAPSRECPDGIINVGAKLQKEDVMVNRVHFKAEEQGAEFEVTPRPVRYKGKKDASVSSVFVTSSGKKFMVAKLMISEMRIPEVGDKFSSRHGQKGVVGMIVPQRDLPFTETGTVPDIVMNPHGFPSRMTVGKLLELLTGKAACLLGRISTSSAFDDKKKCVGCKEGCVCRTRCGPRASSC